MGSAALEEAGVRRIEKLKLNTIASKINNTLFFISPPPLKNLFTKFSIPFFALIHLPSI
jgi:hypothetical protein